MKRIWAGLGALAVLAGCSSGRSHSPSAATTSITSTAGMPANTVPAKAAPANTAPANTAPTTCPVALRTIVSRADPRALVATSDEHSLDLITCVYRLRRTAPTACTRASVIINTQPQAFKAFDRWTVETGQNSMWTHNPALNPVPVSGIGILAEWVPGTTTFEAATATSWVAVFLTCPKHAVATLALGKALGRAGLSAAS